MKALYLSTRSPNKQEATTWFGRYCEESDLILSTDISAAKTFILEELIDNQKHIDFIITDWQFGDETAKSLLTWIRSSEATYSAKNFQLKSIPILLIEGDTYSSIIGRGFDGIVKDITGNPIQFNYELTSVIKAWRNRLANDLELIGLDPKTQRVYPGQRSTFIAYYRLNVLSRYFVDSKSKLLNYIWTFSDVNYMDNSNFEFLNKIHSTIPEKDFHRFFRTNPTFLTGEDFIFSIYEKHFYKNGTRRYDEPDFINKPHEYAIRNPEIFEVKLQSQRLLRHDAHAFLSKAKKSFEQVKRYKRYFTSTLPEHLFHIRNHLGKTFPYYDFTLLMGNNEEKLEHEDLIERLKTEYELSDIKHITYEELLERHVRLCNRLRQFSIF